MFSMYVDRASELVREHKVHLGSVTDAVKRKLRNCHYESKVLLYNCKCLEQGIVIGEDIPDVPILWATNGHIGISVFLAINSYVQHGASRVTTLRFTWDGNPVLFELPEKGARKAYVPEEGRRRLKEQVSCPVCHNHQEMSLELMPKYQGWKCNRCGTVHKLKMHCPICKTGIIVFTEFGGFCYSCSGTPSH